MVTYILLMRLTEQGAKDIKNAPKRIEAAVKGVEAMGGKVKAFYAVMGQYDYIAIGELPSDEVGMTFLLGLNSQGNVKTISLKAFTKEQFAAIAQKLP